MKDFDPQALVARILSDAASSHIDDATFRQRASRMVRRLQRELDQQLAEQAAIRKHSNVASASRYKFIAVPSEGGSTSVSILRSRFEELVRVLGSPQAVTALARKAASGFKPESGMSRSAYVRRRLQQRVAHFEAPTEGSGAGRQRRVR